MLTVQTSDHQCTSGQSTLDAGRVHFGMRHCRCFCIWEVLATAGSVALLLWVTIIYLKNPTVFHVFESESSKIQCYSSRPCIRKCCPRGEELQQPNPNETSGCYPTILSHFSISDIPQDNNGSQWDDARFDIVYENCDKHNPEKEGETVLLLANGSVKINETDTRELTKYCIDFKVDKTYVFVCSDEVTNEISRGFVFGYIFSACSLFLTTVVYLIIAITRNARQRLQISPTHLTVILNYLPSLLFTYVVLSVVYANPFNMNLDHPFACRLICE